MGHGHHGGMYITSWRNSCTDKSEKKKMQIKLEYQLVHNSGARMPFTLMTLSMSLQIGHSQ